MQIRSESSSDRLKLEMENMKQDKEKEIDKLDKILQETTAENRQLKSIVTGKEEVSYMNNISLTY